MIECTYHRLISVSAETGQSMISFSLTYSWLLWLGTIRIVLPGAPLWVRARVNGLEGGFSGLVNGTPQASSTVEIRRYIRRHPLSSTITVYFPGVQQVPSIRVFYRRIPSPKLQSPP